MDNYMYLSRSFVVVHCVVFVGSNMRLGTQGFVKGLEEEGELGS